MSEEPETVQLDERSTEALVERIANRIKPKEPPKTETPPPAPTPAPATIPEKISALSDEEVADLADSIIERVEERKAGKTPEPTVNDALKAAVKENPEQALSTYFQAAGEQQRKRDEIRREAAENE